MSQDRSHLGRPLGSMPLSCASCAACPALECPVRDVSGDSPSSTVTTTRRAFIGASAATITLSSLIGPRIAVAQDVTATTAEASATALACTPLTAERTEGPYYIEDALLRDDITEGQPGIPLDLRMTIIDAMSCEPLDNVAVDIWHCNAAGSYSGISGGMGNDDTTGETFLRGIQLTGPDGVAAIRTIYPGWYQGRATHIHLKVHVGGTADDGTYEGGTVAHTGQLFFDDDLTDKIATLDPYVGRTIARTRNDDDGVLAGGLNEPGFFLDMTPVDSDDLTKGFTGVVTLGIDPTAISQEDGPGGMPSQGGPRSQPPGSPGQQDIGEETGSL